MAFLTRLRPAVSTIPMKTLVSPADLEYYFGSSGLSCQRPDRDIAHALRRTPISRRHRPRRGHRVHFPSWSHSKMNSASTHTVLVEPQPVRVAQGTRLWTSSGKRPAGRFSICADDDSEICIPGGGGSGDRLPIAFLHSTGRIIGRHRARVERASPRRTVRRQ